jgi:peptidoglycan/LPS O-acetylase OafA/YrhL
VTGLVFLLMQALSGIGLLARLWSWPGRISLSVYALHIVAIAISDNTRLTAHLPDQVLLSLFAYWLGAFALGWYYRKRKGPLESLLASWLRNA